MLLKRKLNLTGILLIRRKTDKIHEQTIGLSHYIGCVKYKTVTYFRIDENVAVGYIYDKHTVMMQSQQKKSFDEMNESKIIVIKQANKMQCYHHIFRSGSGLKIFKQSICN